jgi:NAD(P)-dependent dehydrogenase (short-subunit alcohol dehydrogenase family)
MRWLITGAGRGLGAGLAHSLLKRGDDVIATVRRTADGDALARAGARVELLDVADGGSREDFARRLEGVALDVLVNNAGLMPARTSLSDVRSDDLRAAFEVNAVGPFELTRALLANLRAGERRLVAHLTSRMGSIADNTSGGSYAYRASKSALNMLNRSLSLDLAAEGFTCLVLHPGWVRTEMGGSGAPMTVEDSVVRLLGLLDRARSADTGRFLGPDGQDLPW